MAYELSRVIISNYINELDICDGVIIKEKCENPEESDDFVDMYVEDGLREHQCEILRDVLGRGREGSVTEDKRDRLAKNGFSQLFIDNIAGDDGLRTVHERVKRIGEKLFLPGNKVDNPDDQELLKEIAEIGPAATPLIPKLKAEIGNIRSWLDRLGDEFPLGIHETTPEAYALTSRSTDILRAIGSMGEEAKEALPFLLTVLDDDAFLKRTHMAAADALGLIGDESAKEALETAVWGGFAGFGMKTDTSLRLHCAMSLWRMDEKKYLDRILPIFIQALNDRQGFTDGFITSTQLLGEMDVPEAIDLLIEALKQPRKKKIRLMIHEETSNYLPREEAVKALRKHGKKAARAEGKLIFLMKEEHWDWSLCTIIAEVLGNIGTDRAIPVLVGALSNTSSKLHRTAAEALAKIDPERAVSELTKLMNYTGGDGLSKRTLIIGSGDEAVYKKIDAINSAETLLSMDMPEATAEVEKALKNKKMNKSVKVEIEKIYATHVDAKCKNSDDEPVALAMF